MITTVELRNSLCALFDDKIVLSDGDDNGNQRESLTAFEPRLVQAQIYRDIQNDVRFGVLSNAYSEIIKLTDVSGVYIIWLLYYPTL